MQFFRPFFTLLIMLFSVISSTFIAAIFHKIAAIALLQFDVVQCCDAARSAHIFGGPYCFIFFCRCCHHN
jgi:hypothetical protein